MKSTWWAIRLIVLLGIENVGVYEIYLVGYPLDFSEAIAAPVYPDVELVIIQWKQLALE